MSPAQRPRKKSNSNVRITPKKRSISKSSVKKRSIKNNVRKKNSATVVLLFVVGVASLGTYLVRNYFYKDSVSAGNTYDYTVSADQLPTMLYFEVDSFDSDPVIVKKVHFLVFDKMQKKILVYEVPLDVEVELPGKYGADTLSKAFALGSLNSDDILASGISSVKDSVFKLFKFKVDSVLVVDPVSRPYFDDIFLNSASIRKASFIKNSKSLDYYSDLSQSELASLAVFSGSLPNSQLYSYKYGTDYNFDSVTSVFKDITLDYFVSNESVSIAVLNGTKKSGVATQVSDVIDNLGGRVVAIDNASREYEKTTIIASDLDSETVKILKRIFLVDNLVQKEAVTNSLGSSDYLENEVFRADVVLVLGVDRAGNF